MSVSKKELNYRTIVRIEAGAYARQAGFVTSAGKKYKMFKFDAPCNDEKEDCAHVVVQDCAQKSHGLLIPLQHLSLLSAGKAHARVVARLAQIDAEAKAFDEKWAKSFARYKRSLKKSQSE